ncbi:MAG: ATP-binding protein, partial [Clostridia bacterium]|nr:ATP-binding protein [Clostridia bacterium]
MNQTENIKQYARALRLATLATTCDALIHQAQIDTPSYLEFTEMILSKEVEQRQKNDFEKRIKVARLPLCHDLDTFDFNYSAGITKPQMKQLRELVWLEQNYNVVLMGPSGVGKSFIASGLVYEAVKQGYRACFYTMEDIINIIRLKDLSSSALAAYTKLMKVHLLAIDDMMLLPIKKDEAVGFFNLINYLHERTSVIITTNKSPTEWAQTLDDTVLATALLDRLLYRCEVIKLQGYGNN